MNSRQIESFLERVDGSFEMARQEAAEYIRQHQAEIVSSLASQGWAVVRLRAGDIRIELKDLELAAA